LNREAAKTAKESLYLFAVFAASRFSLPV
jgi:hypothetical protein